MFKFKFSFKEKGYHLKGDKPFFFPAVGKPGEIKNNLALIEGPNGSGKTTFLNIISIAFGYLEKTSALESKPKLQSILKDINENATLSYYLELEYPDNHLIIERSANSTAEKITFNKKNVGPDFITKHYDILYLTEDDPKKIISSTTDNLKEFMNQTKKELVDYETFLHQKLLNITRQKEYRDEIKGNKVKLDAAKKRLDEVNKKINGLKKIEKEITKKEKVEHNISVLENEKEIVKKYDEYKDIYHKLIKNRSQETREELEKSNDKINEYQEKISQTNLGIKDIVEELNKYEGVDIDFDKVINFAEIEIEKYFKDIKQKHQAELSIAQQIELIEDFLNVLGRYDPTIKVPLLDKTVHEFSEELDKARIKFRVKEQDGSALTEKIKSLAELLYRKKKCETELKRHKTRRANLLPALSEIPKKFRKMSGQEIADKYNEFYNTNKELEVIKEKGNLGYFKNELKQFNKIKLSADEVANQLTQLNQDRIRNELAIKQLKKLIETTTENQKGHDQTSYSEKKIQKLNRTIAELKKKIDFWNQILLDPKKIYKALSETKDKNKLESYHKFIKTIGVFFAEQFEPLPYDMKLHNVVFFDIEMEEFKTKENRIIKLKKLSKGQTKTASLSSGLEKINESKKAIVLIDEISDVDPINLKLIRDKLDKKIENNEAVLGILVKPPTEYSSHKEIKIHEW